MVNKPYHHGNLRAALIEAGIEMVNQEGIAGCSLRKVAAKCNVSRGAPYAHFKDKNDMLESMQKYVMEKFVSILNQAIAECADSDKLLLAIGKAYIYFFVDNPNYYSFLFNQSNIKIVLNNDKMTDSNNKDVEHGSTEIFLFMDRLDIPESLQMQNFIAVWSIVHGLAGIVTMKGVEFDGDWNTMIEKVLSDNLTLYK